MCVELLLSLLMHVVVVAVATVAVVLLLLLLLLRTFGFVLLVSEGGAVRAAYLVGY